MAPTTPPTIMPAIAPVDSRLLLELPELKLSGDEEDDEEVLVRLVTRVLLDPGTALVGSISYEPRPPPFQLLTKISPFIGEPVLISSQ